MWAVTLSPAIDVAILKRVCDAYRILHEVNLQTKLTIVCTALPNHAYPWCVEMLLVEYPTETGQAADGAHRHFSGLWALYPGRQLSPFDASRERGRGRAYAHSKLAAGSGHTGWSRAWAACLAARSLDGALVEKRSVALVADFFTASFFGTHPPLKPTYKDQGCQTCFVRDGPPPRP